MSAPNETASIVPVAAVIATYKRPVELRRLLAGLAAGTRRPARVIIVDNAASAETVTLVNSCGLNAEVIPLASNPGPGAAWKCGMETAWECAEIEWFWVMDDDVVIGPDVLEKMLAADRDADAVAPLLTDHDGNVWGFPEPLDPELRGKIREALTPADCLLKLGAGPHEFCWCTGACVLVHRRVIEKAGFHRTDFHILGEDLEYSMRLSACGKCVFVCDVVVPHLPPAPSTPISPDALSHRIKFLSLLQNLTYLAIYSPHSRHMWRYVPGNFRRYFRTIRAKHWWEALWAGAGGLVGQPAGGAIGRKLRQKLTQDR